jgi:mono/diheme cytochrome c family protein
MCKISWPTLLIVATLVLVACGSGAGGGQPATSVASPRGESTPAPTHQASTDEPEGSEAAAETGEGLGQGRGMGHGGGMMARHHAVVPAPYAGLTNPVDADQASLERGAESYSTLCASCHGDGGMGDGPAGASLDPAPSPVAHTSQMLGDDLLFWRISEGGAMEPFSSAMPAWKDSLGEEARWDLVNYMRALGRGQVQPRHSAGGAALDPAEEAAKHAEMVDQGVAQGLISPAEGELFLEVHGAMDDLAADADSPRVGPMNQRRAALLAQLVDTGTITQEHADAFEDIHLRLEEAGLMQ